MNGRLWRVGMTTVTCGSGVHLPPDAHRAPLERDRRGLRRAVEVLLRRPRPTPARVARGRRAQVRRAPAGSAATRSASRSAAQHAGPTRSCVVEVRRRMPATAREPPVADGERAAEVVRAEQRLGRPRGTEPRIGAAAVAVDEVVVPVDEVDQRVLARDLRDLEDSSRARAGRRPRRTTTKSRSAPGEPVVGSASRSRRARPRELDAIVGDAADRALRRRPDDHALPVPPRLPDEDSAACGRDRRRSPCGSRRTWTMNGFDDVVPTAGECSASRARPTSWPWHQRA